MQQEQGAVIQSVSCAVIYEVNLEIEPEVADEFKIWLHSHISEMLALPGFVSARGFKRQPDEEGCAGIPLLLTVHYTLESREALEKYFKEHAPRMREDGMKRFGGNFKASRRILYDWS